jgi:nucleotide-binding universal stress UspA family protein
MSDHLPDELFEHVLIPVAAEVDARMARETILPYLEQVGGVATVVHVIKQSKGGIDPSPESIRSEDAQKLFEIVSEDHEDSVVAETRTAYGTNIAEAIFDVAHEVGASAIVFSPREKSRLIRLLSGDTALSLVTNPDVPVLAIPQREQTE